MILMKLKHLTFPFSENCQKQLNKVISAIGSDVSHFKNVNTYTASSYDQWREVEAWTCAIGEIISMTLSVFLWNEGN